MNYKVELGAYIKFIDTDGTNKDFFEGDEVICCVGTDKRYVGRIVQIGNYQEDGEVDSELAIHLDTSASKTSYSGEVVKFADITYICKNPLKEELAKTMDKDETDKKTFVNMLVGMGYEKKVVENCWDSMKKVMNFHGIPVEKALACAIYALENKCSITVPMKDICGVDIAEMESLQQNLEKASAYSWSMVFKSLAELIVTAVKYNKHKEK